MIGAAQKTYASKALGMLKAKQGPAPYYQQLKAAPHGHGLQKLAAAQQKAQQMAMAMGGLSNGLMGTNNTTFGVYLNTASTATTTTLSNFNVGNNIFLTTTTGTGGSAIHAPLVQAAPTSYDGKIRITDGQAAKVALPDGTIVDVKADGSFEIIDKDATIKYRANRMREFNRFLNASDQVEGFIRYCGELGISKQDMLELPLNTFIAWLVVEAARADAEPEPDVPLLADLRKIRFPRCVQCQRFIPHDYPRKRLDFCRPLCFDRYQRRIVAPPPVKLLEVA